MEINQCEAAEFFDDLPGFVEVIRYEDGVFDEGKVEIVGREDAERLKKEYLSKTLRKLATEKDEDLCGIYCVSEFRTEESVLPFRIRLYGGRIENKYFDPVEEYYTTYGVVYSPERARMKLRNDRKYREIRPLTLREANAFVKKYHEHNDTVTGCKFAIGLYDGGRMTGAAICGRPVSRNLDDGKTLEINRLCISKDLVGNGASMLYSRCVRIAKEMGYEKVESAYLESNSSRLQEHEIYLRL